MQLDLQTKDETDVLRRVLESYLSDLRMEIGKTENYAMRQALKQDEETIKVLLERLARMAAPA